MKEMKWVSLYVENQIGVLAKISGLFSGKAYNMESLSVGPTDDKTVSRITIGMESDDVTFEMVKKQLNRCVEVIKVIDFTTLPVHLKELMFVKIKNCGPEEKEEIFRIAQVYNAKVADCGKDSILLESVHTEGRNNDLAALLKSSFKNIEVVRGGSVAIESVSMNER